MRYAPSTSCFGFSASGVKRSFTLRELDEVARAYNLRCALEYNLAPSFKAYWVLLIRRILADSRDKDLAAWQRMVKDITGPDYDLPLALEVTSGALLYHK